MRAVRTMDGEFQVVQVTEPEVEVESDELVNVVAAGICGSDLHLVGFGLTGTFGHEVAGHLADGRPVAVQPTLACGSCDRCSAGAFQQCRSLAIYGITMDGGMADRMVLDSSCLIPLDDRVAVSDACLVEPIAVSVHAVHVGGVESGHRVLVIGGGTIGLTAVAAACYTGADVDLSAKHRHQVEAGERLGAGTGVSGEYDVVIEAAGTEDALVSAIEYARPGGTVAIPGVYWEPLSIPNVVSMCLKEIRIQPSSMYGCSDHPDLRETDEAADLLAAVPDLAPALITHRFGLDDAAEAFRVAADREAGAIKVVLEP